MSGTTSSGTTSGTTRTRLRRTTLLAGAAALLLAACGSGGPATPAATGTGAAGGKVDQVKVGIIPIVDVAPIYLGRQQGFFAKRNIELTLESGQGGAAIVPGVVSGQFQFGFSNVTSLLLAESKGLPLKVVVNGVASTGVQGKDFGGVVVKADSPVRSAKDLAGKTVAVNTLKNIGDTTVRASVRKDGGNPDTVKFVEMAFPDMPAAVAGGRVDAAWVVEPFLSIARAQGDRVVAWNYVDAAPDLTVATYFTSAKLAQTNPDLVARFVAAMKESLQYADANPDQARQVLTTYTKIDQKTVQSLTLPKWPVDINRASVQTLADLAVKDGLLTSAPDLGKLLP